eukprot:3474464-Rhodomonas_salina.1
MGAARKERGRDGDVSAWESAVEQEWTRPCTPRSESITGLCNARCCESVETFPPGFCVGQNTSSIKPILFAQLEGPTGFVLRVSRVLYAVSENLLRMAVTDDVFHPEISARPSQRSARGPSQRSAMCARSARGARGVHEAQSEV